MQCSQVCTCSSLLSCYSSTPSLASLRLPADVYANIPSVWPWINSTLFALTGNYLNEPFKPTTGSGEAAQLLPG